mgnify:CR=1 FL=1
MKQKLNKILSMCMVVLCAVTLFAASVTAAEEMSTEEILASSSEELTKAIIELTDEEIEAYKATEDAFTLSAMEAWESSRGELGEFVEIVDKNVVLAQGKYTVTVSCDFTQADADFVYVIKNVNSVPESITVDVKLPLSVNLQRASLNTVMGLGTVFIMLFFLSWVISLLGKICSGIESKAKAAEAPAPAAAPAAPVVEEVEEEADDEELVAVIAAAIAAAEGTTPDGFVVRSVRKVNRRKW